MMIRDTGIRPSELMRARVSDLDFDARTLEIGERNSKTNRRRYVGLTSELIAELGRHIMQNHLDKSAHLNYKKHEEAPRAFP